MKWAIAVLSLGAMAAAGFEIWLGMRQHPRRFLYAWAAWTPLAMLAAFAALWDPADPSGSAVVALMAAPLAYPLFRGLIWLRFDLRGYSDARQAAEAAAEAERMKYRATDFGGVRRATATPPTPTRPAARRRPRLRSPRRSETVDWTRRRANAAPHGWLERRSH